MKTIILKDTSANSERIAVRVSAISIAGNLLLTLLKLLAGILAHSSAMITSAPDILTAFSTVALSFSAANTMSPFSASFFKTEANN